MANLDPIRIDSKPLPATREIEREYRALFDLAGTANAVVNKQDVFTKVNNHFERLSGYKKKDIEGKFSFLDFVHSKDRKRVQTIAQKRFRSPSSAPSTYEFSFVNRKGQEKFVIIWVSMLPNKDCVCSIVDLTEKHQLEAEIRSKEQFLANILRYSVDAIIALDPNGYIRSWNHGAELMFGYRSKEIIGKKYTKLLSPETRHSTENQHWLELFDSQGYVRNITYEARAKDGHLLMVEMTRSAIQDSQGQPIGSSVILRDITDKHREEQRLIQQEKTLALGDLAASLAHEIKNPLNSMVINIEVLKSQLSGLTPKNQPKVSRYLDILASEAQRLNRVIGGVLDFARPIEGELEEVNVANTLGDVTELVRAQAQRQGIDLTLQLEHDLPTIEGIEDQIKQIFLNLILNAFQAMPKGGRITISAKQDSKKTILISVQDTGMGIPRSNYKDIFDLYYSTKEKGSGLGLPLVKRLLAGNGGKIRFKSRVNYGTTFFIDFPTF